MRDTAPASGADSTRPASWDKAAAPETAVPPAANLPGTTSPGGLRSRRRPLAARLAALAAIPVHLY